MKKLLKIENLMYLMIVISPFLDSFSFIYRNFNPNSTISPITILRPIIPIILAIYMFIKYKDTRKIFLVGGILYLVYGVIHLYLYNGLMTEISYGNLLHEAQYIINYSYMIMVLYIFIYFSKLQKIDYKKLKMSLFIMLCGYLFLIYLSLITNTSSNTYIEGIGYKGWNLSGNSLGSILILLECILIPFMFEGNKKFKIISLCIMLLLGVFLTFLLGTRVGLFGFYIVLLIYFMGSLFLNFVKKNKINLKKYLIPIAVVIVIAISLVLVFGSSTLSRRKHLKNIENDLFDPNTNSVAHVTGDTVKFVTDIMNNNVDEKFMSIPQQKAYLSMYKFANKHEILNNNQRVQQIVYHLNLIKYQKSASLILFGNGYEINYGEMTLEMEFIAILLNFGIIGFILYMVPFLIIDIKAIKYFFKNLKNSKINLIMYLAASFLTIAFSLLAGYTFFNASSMIIIVSNHILLKEYYEKE